MMQSFRPLSLVLAFTFLSTGAQALPAQTIAESQVAPLIVDRVDDAHLTILKGSHLHLARSASDRGQVEAGLPMGDLFLVLHRAPEVQRAFDQFVASESDPNSANFHQWLTADEIGERFGPAAADIQSLTAWLRSHGFTVDEVAKDRVTVRFSGTAQQVQAAFHTEIHRFDVKGSGHLANITDVALPSALTPVVTGVLGLHNFYPRPLHRLGQRVTRNAETGAWQRAAATPADGSIHPLAGTGVRPTPLFGTTDTYGDVIEDVAPYDFATIYNVLPLWQKSTPIDGTGQTIAIAGTSNINLADVSAFRTAFGLPTSAAANTPTVIVTNSDPGNCANFASTCFGDLIENTLDVEWSGAVAKGASITLVTSSAPTESTDPLFLSENYIVQNHTASIMNVSYGGCELVLGVAGNTQYNNLWQTAAAEGISVFVATGDAGSPACDQDFDSVDGVPYAAQFGVAVNGIASPPYETAVGGTDLNWGFAAAPHWSTTNSTTTGANALGYIPEVPWNSTCTNPLLFPTLAGDATALGATPVTDAESSCNFVLNNYAAIETNYGVQLAGLIDTIGGGGGASNCITGYSGAPSSCTGGYAKPSWQTGVSGIPADSSRDIPDVAFFASNGFLGSSYLICVSGAGACTYSASAEPAAQEVGGTSVASPAMAGIMALVNQKVGAAQGNPNPVLYSLAAAESYSACSTESATAGGSCLFNDIDTGTIAMACVNGAPNCNTLVATDEIGVLSGYAAGAGYDLATGLGSLNVTNVVNKWPLSSAPLVTLSPTSLAFPSTAQGFSSAAKTVTLTNSGKSALSITGFTVSGANASSFTQTNNCPSSLATSASCTVTVTFKPATTGSLTASLSIADSAYDSPQSVALSGTATVPAPSAAFDAQSVGFGSTAVGGTNTATVSLSNSGTAALAVTGISFTGTNASSFTQTNTCGTSLAAGASCSVTINFKPIVAGTLTATLQAVDNATNSPQTVALSGIATGGGSFTISPSSITFPSTTVGSSASTQAVTITNNSGAAVTFSPTTLTGSGASSFTRTNTNCTSPLANGASCTNVITFTPQSAGTLTATVTYTTSASSSPQTVALSGTGTSAGAGLTVTPGALTFASTAVGSSAATQTITIKNTSSVGVTFSPTTLTGSGASSFSRANTNCTSPLAAGASCTNVITFTPQSAGTLTATVTYTSSAANSPQTVTLSGTGAAASTGLSITPGSLTFASTTVGSSAPTQTITLKNNTSAAVTFTGTTTITGPGASSFTRANTNCTSPLAAGASCTNVITFTPTTAGTLTATVSYFDSASSSAQTVTLTGTGAGASTGLTITPGSLTFASTAIGSSAATQTITLKNATSAAVTFTSATTITGTNASSFTRANTNCTSPLAAGASCTNVITFTPQAGGTLTATVNYFDSASSSAQTVTLTGTGAGLTISPGALSFASTAVGTSAASQTVTLTNSTSAAVTFTATTTITGTNATSFTRMNTNCASPLAAGASCTNVITFTPQSSGALAATLSYYDSASSTAQTIALTGTGH